MKHLVLVNVLDIFHIALTLRINAISNCFKNGDRLCRVNHTSPFIKVCPWIYVVWVGQDRPHCADGWDFWASEGLKYETACRNANRKFRISHWILLWLWGGLFSPPYFWVKIKWYFFIPFFSAGTSTLNRGLHLPDTANDWHKARAYIKRKMAFATTAVRKRWQLGLCLER